MRQSHRFAFLCLAGATLTACQDSISTPPAAEVSLSRSRAGGAPAVANFVSPMDAGQEVHEVLSNASGNVVYRLSRDGRSIEYRVIVAGASALTQGHIHRGPRGQNGPVVAFLFNFAALNATDGVSKNGVIAEGAISSADLVGPLAGGTLSQLLDELRAGNAYANVHTVAFPAGEVRGQVRAAGNPHTR